MLEWVNTSHDITCNSFAVSDNNIDYITSGAPRTKHYQLASNKLGLCLGWKGGRGRRERKEGVREGGREGGEEGRGGREGDPSACEWT